MRMIDLETRVAETLAARAERPIEVERLRAGAVRRATGIRWRRRIGGTAAVVLVALGAVALLRPDAPSASTLPLETAAAPGGIGSDPGLLHFDLDLTGLDGDARGAAATEWISGLGYERVIVFDAAGQQWINVFLAPTAARLDEDLNRFVRPGTGEAVTVGGRAASLREVTYVNQSAWELRWQPGDGVYGAVIVDGQDERLPAEVATAVRLDVVQRCVAPVRLTALPEGARWSECQTQLRRDPEPGQHRWVRSGITVNRADGNALFIWSTERNDTDPQVRTAFRPDRSVRDHPAMWLTPANGDTKTGLWSAAFGPVDLFVTGVDSEHADWLTEDDARWAAEHVEVSADLNAPSSWARRPVG